jgi:hypothetical protein
MDTKKSQELNILRKVYPETEYKLIQENENPDFILSDKDNNPFGVEITKYYDTPSSARFKNIPNYTEKLMNSEFIHKQDIGILKVDEIVIVDKKGREISTPNKGVLRELPQPIERINALKDIVSGKNIKHAQLYDKSMPIDLVIYDRGDLTAGLEIQRNEILDYLHKQEEANTLVSPFRKIILLIEESNKSTIKILLKSIQLTSFQ